MGSAASNDLVGALYRLVLGREADPAGRDHFAALVDGGATASVIERHLQASDEYLAKQSPPKPLHPLSRHSTTFDDRDVSYFMHRGRFRPLTIALETVNICNNDCIICPYSSQTRKRAAMSMDLFDKFLEDYAEIGGGPISLTPLVGESLLDKRLRQRLQRLGAARHVTGISMTTNASMAHLYSDEELIEILAFFDRIVVSVYGMNRDEYQTMTRKDDYERFRQGLVRVLRFTDPGVVSVGIRHLVDHTDAEVRAWIDEVASAAGCPSPRLASITKEFANWSHFDTATKLPFAASWKPVAQNTVQCGIPLLGFQVLASGLVSFCACANFDGSPDLIVGDLRTSSLADILESEEIAKLWDWQEHGVPDFCKTCSFHIPLDGIAAMKGVYSDPLMVIGG